MRVIRLCVGEGNGIDKACLMTAANMLIGREADLDKATEGNCICEMLRRFIITTNDSMGEDSPALLSELYAPLIYELPGTRSEDPEVRVRRAFKFVDWIARRVAPVAFEAVRLPITAERMRQLPEVTDREAVLRAAGIVGEVYRLDGGVQPLTAAGIFRVLNANIGAHNVEDIAALAAAVACDAAQSPIDNRPISKAAVEEIWRMCPEIIRDVIAIGDKRPVETVLTEEDLCGRLGTLSV